MVSILIHFGTQVQTFRPPNGQIPVDTVHVNKARRSRLGRPQKNDGLPHLWILLVNAAHSRPAGKRMGSRCHDRGGIAAGRGGFARSGCGGVESKEEMPEVTRFFGIVIRMYSETIVRHISMPNMANTRPSLR